MGEMGLINRFDEYYLSQGANFTQCIITKTLRENNFETFQILEEAPKSKKKTQIQVPHNLKSSNRGGCNR